jgi:hypothetical protein
MRSKDQWLALCRVWSQADIAFGAYKPLAFTAPIREQLEARQAWIETIAIAARQSLGWMRLAEDSGECGLTIPSECGKVTV